jgi:hypothetical protein
MNEQPNFTLWTINLEKSLTNWNNDFLVNGRYFYSLCRNKIFSTQKIYSKVHYLFIYLSIYVCTYLSFYVPIHLPLFPLLICLSVHLNSYLSTRKYTYFLFTCDTFRISGMHRKLSTNVLLFGQVRTLIHKPTHLTC